MRFLPLYILLFVLSSSLVSCSRDGEEQEHESVSSAQALAREITSRVDLIGGDRALGDVGDFLLENDKVRIVIQAPGFSRGFGIFGGSIIDADIRRLSEEGDSGGGVGRDQLGEMFPAFFLQAVRVDSVTIENDGRNGEPARIVASGLGGDFLSLVSNPVRLALGEEDDPENWRYDIIYELAPGESWVTVTLRATNVSDQDINPLRSAVISNVLEQGGINNIPVGDVALFGDTSKIFAPGFGFDLRFGLQRAYAADLPSRTFPGLIAPWLATRSEAGVSYGYAIKPTHNNFAWNSRFGGQNCLSRYQELGVEMDRTTLMLPFVASGFVGIFYDSLPRDQAFADVDAPRCESAEDCESGEICAELEARHVLQQGPLPERDADSSDDDTAVEPESTEEEGEVLAWCASSCRSDWDCEDGYVCDGGGCVPIVPPTCATGGGRLQTFAPGQYYEATKYLVIGQGIAEVVGYIQDLHQVPVGTLTGEVIDEISGAPAANAEVFIYTREDAEARLERVREELEEESTEEGSSAELTISDVLRLEEREDGGYVRRVFMHSDLDSGGRFRANLPPGEYSARVVRDGALNGIDPQTGEDHTTFVDFSVEEAERTFVRMRAPEAGRVVVHLFDSAGRRLPAKATAVGVYNAEFANRNPQTFLYDLRIRESFRNSDMLPDDPEDDGSRRYIEQSAYSDEGVATLRLRPGTYTIVSSRGPEYGVEETEITVRAGRTETVSHRLQRVNHMEGWIAGDLHIHAINSIDSSIPMDPRVRAIAGEGVEWAVATDHNYVTDFAPYIARNNLQDWVMSSVGLEVTTLEAGHFNGFPLRYELGPITHGAFEWADRPPDELMDELRAMGKYGPENVLVQVNHPRDSIIGYFDQFRRDGLTAEFIPPSSPLAAVSGPAFYDVDEDGEEIRTGEGSRFSLDFEVLEIINGKRLEQLRHYRIPADVPDEIRDQLESRGVNPGEILLESNGRVAFPGAVDDWFNLLNQGHRFIGVGNSDTHGAEQEAGFPRTMIYTGESDVRKLTELDMVHAMRSRRVFTTNGPMVDFWIDDPESGAMGSEMEADGDSLDLHVVVTSVPWVRPERVNIYRNGQIADIHMLDEGRDYRTEPYVATLDVEEDSWFLVEVIGYESMFPVVRPDEVPSLDLTDAVGALAGPLGLDGGGVVDIEPDLAAPVQPYAITNPVWVRTSESEWTAPGIPSREELISANNDPGLNQNPTTIFFNADGTAKTVRLPGFRDRPYAMVDGNEHGHEHHHGHGHGHEHHHGHGHGHEHHHGHGHEHGHAWRGEVPGEHGMRRHFDHAHHPHDHSHLPFDELPRDTYDVRRLFDLFCDAH